MLWRLQLEREDGSDISSAAFSDSKQSQVKVVQSSTGLSFEQSDSKSIHVSPELIASIACKDGAAFVTCFTHNAFIQPEVASALYGQSRYPFPISTNAHLHSFWLRPRDRILFPELKYSLRAELAPDSLPNQGVEVKSSGAASMNGDIQLAADEYPDEMDLDATIVRPSAVESQVEGPPFSTAPSQFIVQETPTAVRTSRLPTESPTALKAGANGSSHPQLPVEETVPEHAADPADFAPEADEVPDGNISPSKGAKDLQQADADDDAIVLGIAKQTPKRTYSSKKRGLKRDITEAEDVEAPETSDGRSSKRQRKSVNNVDTSPVQEDGSPVAAPPSDGKLRRESVKDSKSPITKKGTSPGQTPPLVVFSQSSIESKKAVLKFLDSKGVTVAQDVSLNKDRSTICCVGKGDLKTTAKVLMALALNCSVVTDDWIEESVTAKKLLEPKRYLVESLKSSKDNDRTHLFEGKNIIFTHATRKAYGTGFISVTSILRAAGARDIQIQAAREIDADSDTLVIGMDKGDNDALALLQKNIECYSKELISASILRGELLVDDPKMHLSGVVDTRKTPPSKKGKRKS